MSVISFCFAPSFCEEVHVHVCGMFKIYDSWKFVHFMVDGYIVTRCLTSVYNAILFRIDYIMSWYKKAVHRLMELF